jgi:HSP20 family protein
MEGLAMILHKLSSLPTWSVPFGELDDLRRRMERLLAPLTESTGLRTAGVFPAVNLAEDSQSLFLRAELPGVKSEDLEITLENETLTLAGERVMPAENDEVSYHRREREWGKFRRSLSVPVKVDPNHVQARYRNGILTVTLAKAPESRPKQIAIQAGA